MCSSSSRHDECLNPTLIVSAFKFNVGMSLVVALCIHATRQCTAVPLADACQPKREKLKLLMGVVCTQACLNSLLMIIVLFLGQGCLKFLVHFRMYPEKLSMHPFGAASKSRRSH